MAVVFHQVKNVYNFADSSSKSVLASTSPRRADICLKSILIPLCHRFGLNLFIYLKTKKPEAKLVCTLFSLHNE